MFDVFFDKASKLNAQGQAFALAMVVRYEAPSSGKTGDKAIITPDGKIEGWIGGGCTQPVVIREALNVLKDGQPRLIRIAPSNDDKTAGIVSYPMTCHSGGALDVYIEPVFPKPHLVVFGNSVVAQTLVRLAKAIHYQVTVVVEDAAFVRAENADHVVGDWDVSSLPLNAKTFAVVATQGEGDEEAIKQVLQYQWGYQAFVASRKKASAIFDSLIAQDVPAEGLAQLNVPAGLDIKARLPEEIAVSILAEIIQKTRTADIHRDQEATLIPEDYTAEKLQIGEMSCAHCVANVEKILTGLEGVEVGQVEIGSAEVVYHPASINRDAIAEALQSKGYMLEN